MCFLHLYNMIKIRPFPQLSIVEPIVEAFYWLSFGNFKKHQPFSMRLCLSLWLMQDSNWKGRVLWKLSGGLATILQNWISCDKQKMREAHITRRGTSFYILIFIEKKSSTVKLNAAFYDTASNKKYLKIVHPLPWMKTSTSSYNGTNKDIERPTPLILKRRYAFRECWE